MKFPIMPGLLLWGAASFGCLAALASYKSEPGAQGVSIRRWPAGSAIRREAGRPTLVLFLHPRCPCTRVSVDELISILSRAPNRADLQVAFYTPSEADDDWADTGARRLIAGLPGVTVHRDGDGVEARRFGAATSGHVLLYDSSGRLRFSGGITGARGHAGDNPGKRAVLDSLLGREAGLESAPVYGCAILEDGEVTP